MTVAPVGSQAPRFVLAPSSVVDALYDAVRHRIVNGELVGGEKLTEARLTGEYGVARTTAKACLERLTTAGLLRRTAHRTAVVTELGAAEVSDLYFARLAVEGAAVRRLAERRDLPATATAAQAQVVSAVDAHDFRRQAEADMAFHAALVNGAGSERLSRMHGLIMGEVHLTMGQSRAHLVPGRSAVGDEHDAILAAVLAGDAAGAVAALETHLAHAQSRVQARLARAAAQQDAQQEAQQQADPGAAN
ncbi:GntR family transcriptional regulator [Paenibacillus sp. TRM 82003]|uniref:GntR family transcriptional regulator n=1 Tax=Kineococcus sp. TRM81007 TaxID=2925831 RepID=UPI001F572E53|nr:GntR family transcriptional regulator [Kineococcus sp. TRM81007]MCI2237768.1 GntR family transcriptional regulator [Kineococcus sp. TRM81007]MCI3921787.1 GntR family transcriptional regulator [Paenibacillus sp. TRM 82003]